MPGAKQQSQQQQSSGCIDDLLYVIHSSHFLTGITSFNLSQIFIGRILSFIPFYQWEKLRLRGIKSLPRVTWLCQSHILALKHTLIIAMLSADRVRRCPLVRYHSFLELWSKPFSWNSSLINSEHPSTSAFPSHMPPLSHLNCLHWILHCSLPSSCLCSCCTKSVLSLV